MFLKKIRHERSWWFSKDMLELVFSLRCLGEHTFFLEAKRRQFLLNAFRTAKSVKHLG